MGRVSKAGPTERGEPEEYSLATKRARRIRAEVAGQISEHLTSADLTGSREYVAMRVRTYAQAVAAEDPLVVRAALMELATAAGAAICHIDMAGPVRPPAMRNGAPVNGVGLRASSNGRNGNGNGNGR